MVSLILHVQYNYTTVTLTKTHTQLIVNTYDEQHNNERIHN